jgi:antitoxin ParD1/3/4
MNISLTEQLEKFVSEQVESGAYQSASEVVRDGLRLLAERRKIEELKLAALRSAKVSRVVPLNRTIWKPSSRKHAQAISVAANSWRVSFADLELSRISSKFGAASPTIPVSPEQINIFVA